jgi:hypothetical protein
MERAPTNPRDKARDDLTTEMTKRVVKHITGKTNPRSLLRYRFFDFMLKCQHKIKDSTTQRRKFHRRVSREI